MTFNNNSSKRSISHKLNTEQTSEYTGEEIPLYCSSCNILVGYFVTRPNSPTDKANKLLEKLMPDPVSDDEFLCVKCRIGSS